MSKTLREPHRAKCSGATPRGKNFYGGRRMFAQKQAESKKIHKSALIKERVISVSSLSLSANIYLPKNKHAVDDIIVFVHGFCGNKSENGLFDEIAHHCANNNIGAILYDWRGIGTSEGDFKKTSLQDHVNDFREVLSWTRSQYSSVKNIHALGFSLGATIIALATNEGEKLDKIAYLSPALRPNISMWPRYQDEGIQKSLSEYGYFAKPGCGTKVGIKLLESLRDTDLGLDSFVSKYPLLACWGKADTRIDASHNQNILKHSLEQASWLNYLEVEDASHSLRPGETNWPKVGELVSNWFLKKYSDSSDQDLSKLWKSMNLK